MTRLYLVRHGTHDLVGKVLAGRMPGVSLSDAGRAQAEALAAYCSSLRDVAAVLSSPVERCLQTAELIAARLGLRLQQNAALDELDCGEWTGTSFADLAADPRWRAWNSERGRAVVPGGESMAAVQARAMGLVSNLSAGDGGAVVSVTHSDVIKIVVLTLIGAPLDRHDRLEIDPGSVTTVDLWAGGGRVVRSNQAVA